MKVYVVTILFDEWGELPYNNGVYSSKEKAEKSIEEFLSQIEDKEERELYTCSIEEYELDV